MSDADYEAYLGLLSRFLRLSAGQREEIRRELRAHLEETIEDAVARGVPRERAVLLALEDFGDAAELAAKFSSIGRRRRWIMQGTLTAACIGLVALALNAWAPHWTVSVTADEAAPAHAGAPPLAKSLNAEPAPQSGAQGAANGAIEDALARRIDVDFEDTPLPQVVEFFADSLKINLVVAWGALEDNAIDRENTVTLHLKDIVAEDALALALRLVSREVPLDWQVERDVLIISTEDDLFRQLSTRMYDVRDLISVPDQISRAGAGGNRAAARRSTSITADRMTLNADRVELTSTDPFGQAIVFVQNSPRRELDEGRAEELILLIQRIVKPDSWLDNGGSAYLQIFDATLVVHNTGSAHRQIERLLDALHAAVSSGPTR